MSSPSLRFQRFTWMDALIAVLIFAVALVLYIRTLAPSLLPGDSGEFQTLSALLGDTHPTGYPVYLALAKPFTYLPIADIAWRVNLVSAIMAALTVAGVYLTAQLLTGYRILALAGALLLMVSPTFWSQALIAEVYAPGAAFLIAVLGLLVWWDESNAAWALFLAGILGGLSLGVHMTVALLAPAVLLFLALHHHRGWAMWRAALAGAGAGLLLTLASFWLIDRHNPAANYFQAVIMPSISAWDMTPADLDSPWERLWFGWSAQQFQPFMWQFQVFGDQAQTFWEGLPDELGAVTPWLAVLGGVWLLGKRWRVGLLILLALTLQLLFTFSYAIWDLYVFFIPAYVLMTLLVSAGLAAVADGIMWLAGKLRPQEPPDWLRPAITGILALLTLILVVWPVFQPYQESVAVGVIPFDFEEYPRFNSQLSVLAQLTVDELPPNAILFADWDMIWPYYYTAHVLGRRPDLTFHETYPRDDRPELADSVIVYVNDHIDQHPIFFSERDARLKRAGFKLRSVRIGPQRLILVEKK